MIPNGAFAADTSGDAASEYRQARALLESNPKMALEIAKKLGEDPQKLAEVEDRRLDLLVKAAEHAGMVDEAIDALAALADAAYQPMDALYAQVERGELLLLQGRLEASGEAVSAADRAASRVGEQSTQSRFFLARRWRLQHDLMLALANAAEKKDSAAPKNYLNNARQAARTLLVEFPTEDATERDGLILGEADLDAAELFERARQLYDHWSYQEARRLFEKLRANPQYAGEATWYLAHLALNKLRDRPKEAEALFRELAENGPHRHESLYQVARAQMNQERYEDALKTLDIYRERYPTGSHTESVYYYRGWLPYDHRQNEAAVEGFKNYLARYGKRAGRASYVYGFLAWTYMRLGQWQNAIDTYEQVRSFGNMLVWGKALYWQAYALHQLKKDAGALAKLDALRQTYPVTYYGMLGEQLRARISGKDARASRVWWPEGSATSADVATRYKTFDEFTLRGLSAQTAEKWQRVQALVAIDELFRARQEVDEIRDALLRAVPVAERDAWIYALGQYVEDFHPMWVAATGGTISAHPRPPKPGSLEAKMAYPRAYRQVVDAVASEFELPPELMWAIMRQESRYRPAQISYTDAVGALQMIPRTARKVARDLGIVYDPRTFPRPSVGFRYSGYYLRKLLDTFQGLIVPTAGAYNSGPRVVAYWFRHNPDADFAWLIEEFAYNEGRNYSRKVAEHMLRYLYLYEPDAERRGRVLDMLFPTSRDIELPDAVGY